MHTTPHIRVHALNRASCGALLWRQCGTLWATTVVKATFRLVPGGSATLTDPLELICEERENFIGDIEAADEVVPLLPNAGVVLTAWACAPGGQRTPSMTVRLGLARERPLIDKALYVYGHRDRDDPSPQPFLKLPISYERAYGGYAMPANPVGMGDGRGTKPPNIIVPGDERRPGGFGPLSKAWSARKALLGGDDVAGFGGEIADIPAGLNLRYFNPAPLDQQIPALHGDEWIVLDGMHPEHPRVQTRLPGARAKAEWYTAGASGAGDATPIELRADLLVIDATEMVCSLVWRGRFAVARTAKLGEIRVVAGVELPGEALPIGSKGGAVTGLAKTSALDIRAMVPPMPWLQKKPRPEPAPRPQPAEARAPHPAAPRFALPAVIAAPAEVARTLDVDTSLPKPAQPFQPAAPAMPSPASIALPAVVRADESLTGTGGLDVHILLKDPFPFAKPPPAEPDDRPTPVPPPMLGEPDAAAEPVQGTEAPAEPAPPVEPEPEDDDEGDDDEDEVVDVRAEVIARLGARASLLGLDLVGADLHELDFAGRLMTGLDLRHANLRGARFVGVRLAGANLARADLAEAVLDGANLSYATLASATLTRAKLNGATLVDADLTGTDGSQANFTAANLRRAKLSRAKLSGACLDGADLRRAALEGAEIDEGALGRARLGKKKRRTGA